MKILRHPAAPRTTEDEPAPPVETPHSRVRAEEVRRLKELVERGEYEVDEDLLASRIIERWTKDSPEAD